jgi:hypothetical protein
VRKSSEPNWDCCNPATVPLPLVLEGVSPSLASYAINNFYRVIITSYGIISVDNEGSLLVGTRVTTVRRVLRLLMEQAVSRYEE